MTYLWISRNVVKAALEGLQIHGLLHFKITADTVMYSQCIAYSTSTRERTCVKYMYDIHCPLSPYVLHK